MYDADRPIQTSAEDKLNRSLFAKYLARCLLDHKEPESLVVGLYGGWGVGKTSLINLILQELNFASTNLEDTDKPIILNFSAWSYSGQNQLIYNFFRRLSSALRSVDYLDHSDQIVELLELYVSFFTHKPIPKPLRKKHHWFHAAEKEETDGLAWESGRDLTTVKAELNLLLAQQKHKIIIIIDNISRLFDYEIKQIFQIVKSMGDYANTIYLLAFDKHQVAQAINKIDGSGGVEYVEKIVQLPFDVPAIATQDLEAILADRLNEVMVNVPEDSWSAENWADIYYASLVHVFHSVRDITRYVNTLNFSYSRLRDVVNPVDFFALTAIEVFSPEVYFGIRDNKDLFTDLMDQVYELDNDQIKKEKSRLNEVLMRTARFTKDQMLDLLMHLFPRLRRIFYPEQPFYYSDTIARKLRRIASPDLFDVYFRLSMQGNLVPRSEFETLLQLTQDKTAFDQALNRLNQDGRILKFLALLDSSSLQNISKANIPNIVDALFNNGDLFPPGISGPLSLNTAMRIYRIIFSLLNRFDKREERFNILQNAIAAANLSVHVFVNFLYSVQHEHEEESDTYLPVQFRLLNSEQLTSLQKLAVNSIENWASSGRLVDHPHLLSLLTAWLLWGTRLDVEAYVQTFTKTDRGLLAFLIAVFGQSITKAMEQYETSPDWEKQLAIIAQFIDPKALIPHAKLLFEDNYFEKLRENEQLALMIFLSATNAQTSKTIPKTTV